MKCKLKLVTNLTLVIGQKIGSQNPLKNITSTMVPSCFDITLLIITLLTIKNIPKVQTSCSKISSDTLYSSPLSIKTQILFLITLIILLLTFFLLLLLFCFVFSLVLSISIHLSFSYISFYFHPPQ